MKKRFLIFVVSLALFGTAFGCLFSGEADAKAGARPDRIADDSGFDDIRRGPSYELFCDEVEGCSEDGVVDSDGDEVDNDDDNCVDVPNADQTDTDGDGEGDACDDDDDDDDILDADDNCRMVANADQADLDGDGEGDACDNDRDGDWIPNDEDECPDVRGDNVDLSAWPFGGARDGCPADPTSDLPDDVDVPTDYDIVGADTGGACSLGGTGAASPVAFLLLGLALMPMAIRRKKK